MAATTGRLLASLLLSALFIGCSSGPLGSGRELDQNREKWRAQGIASYAYDYRLDCFCGDPGYQPVHIVVEDGEVVQVRLQATGEPVDPSTIQDFPIVEDLFDFIRDALANGPFRFEASYHPELGYPENVFVDFEQQVADDERGFVASNLEAP